MKLKNNGYFITFEGIEGSGKTTCIKELSKVLKKNGVEHLITREPGGTEYSEKVRNLMFEQELDPVIEAFCYASARRDHILKIIKPALAQKKLVICDRFVDSSIVYQGSMNNLRIEKIIEINKLAIGNLEPNLTFIFQIDPKDAQKRLFENKDRELNRFDKRELEFHQRIKNKYKKLGKLFPERIVFIDASINRNKGEIVNDIIKEIKSRTKFEPVFGFDFKYTKERGK